MSKVSSNDIDYVKPLAQRASNLEWITDCDTEPGYTFQNLMKQLSTRGKGVVVIMDEYEIHEYVDDTMHELFCDSAAIALGSAGMRWRRLRTTR